MIVVNKASTILMPIIFISGLSLGLHHQLTTPSPMNNELIGDVIIMDSIIFSGDCKMMGMGLGMGLGMGRTNRKRRLIKVRLLMILYWMG